MSIVDEIERAGLGGRGGAGFPTAVKLRAAHENRATLIVNACDGDVGALKDTWVVAERLDAARRGAQLAAAGRPVLWAAHRGSVTAHRLAEAGLAVLEVPHRYVSSEESSLVSLFHGGPARPMSKRVPFVFGGRDARGRTVKPTLVLNAETVWRIAQIDEYGADWFASLGTPSEPGPRLASVTGHVARSGVVETEAGSPLAALLRAAGGLRPDAEFVLVGGLGGVLLTVEEACGVAWSSEGLGRFGGDVGAGVVRVLDPAECPLEVVARLLEHGAGESAGQCGPCMFGLPALSQQWRALVERPSSAAARQVVDRAGLVAGRGACRHPDGVGRLASSSVRALEGHLREHMQGRCEVRRMSDVA